MKNYRHALSFIVTPLIALGTLTACGADDRILVGEILDSLRDGSDNPTPTATGPETSPTMVPTSSPTGMPTAVPGYDDPPSMQQIVAQNILDAKCGPCHSPMRPIGRMLSSDIDDLIESGMIVPGSAEASPVYQRILANEMPPAGLALLSDEEVEALASFIDSL